jgi:TraK protein
MKKISVMAGLLASVMPAYAVVPMNDALVMEAFVSNKGLTRLSVKGDIIQDIFVYPFMLGEVAVGDAIQLHKSGHVFIAPDGIKEPFYLTVITQKGQVQDLKLSPTVQKSVPLVLTLPEAVKDPDAALQQDRKVLDKYLLAALQGIPPRGFTAEALKASSPRQMGDLTLTPVTVYVSEQYRLSVYDLENTGERDMTLMPEIFLSSDDLAVVFERPVLAVQGKNRMVVLSQTQPVSPLLSEESSLSTEPLPPSPSLKGKTS